MSVVGLGAPSGFDTCELPCAICSSAVVIRIQCFCELYLVLYL